MTPNYIPNFINISGIVLALWPYNQRGTPARSALTARPPARPPPAGRTTFPKVITIPYGKFLPRVKTHLPNCSACGVSFAKPTGIKGFILFSVLIIPLSCNYLILLRKTVAKL